MPTLVSDLLKDTASLLNDTNQTLYTNDALLPFLRMALRELARENQLYDLPLTHEVSTNITVAPGALNLTLPADFVTPIKMEERMVGGRASDWIDMEKADDVPVTEQGQNLKYWMFWEDEIKFQGALTSREVRLTYNKSLVMVNSPTASISMLGVDDFLMNRTAEHAARFLGENPQRADVLRVAADVILNKYTVAQNKTNQSKAVRRIPFGTTLRQWR